MFNTETAPRGGSKRPKAESPADITSRVLWHVLEPLFEEYADGADPGPRRNVHIFEAALVLATGT